MNKRLLNNLLYGALLLSVGTSVFSCKDYDDDIAGLDNRISTVESDMERFKEKIQAALDANLTVASWYPSDDFSQYTIVLSNGDELRLQASGQSTPFYQFKIEDGVWKYSSDKGAGWYNVKTQGTEQTKTYSFMTMKLVLFSSTNRKAKLPRQISALLKMLRLWH